MWKAAHQGLLQQFLQPVLYLWAVEKILRVLLAGKALHQGVEIIAFQIVFDLFHLHFDVFDH